MPSAVMPGKGSIRQVWRPGSLRGIHAAAEIIASRDLNNLYRTSCYFTDRERYKAFCALYAVMRIVDDRIDRVLATREVTDDEKSQEHEILTSWHSIVLSILAGGSPAEHDIFRVNQPGIEDILAAFREAVLLFPVPVQFWENFFKAMSWDLERKRFKTYREFIEYAEGASVAPTTIYLYLITASRPGEGKRYVLPAEFDLIQCGRELGLFAYIGHILRDLSHDISTGDKGLLYLSEEDMALYGVTEEILYADLESGKSSPQLKALVNDLIERARASAVRGRAGMEILGGQLDTDCAFILELIVGMYEKVLDKIGSCGCDVISDRHRLTDMEKIQVAIETAASMGLSLTDDN